MWKKFSALLLISFLLIGSLAGCGTQDTTKDSGQTDTNTPPPVEQNQPRTITDSSGAQVEIPAKVDRIVDLWFAHNEVVAMLGASDKIVGTSNTPQAYPWQYRVIPATKNALSTLGTAFNLEELIGLKPDVVFVSSSSKDADAIINAGIPTVKLAFTDFESMKKCFTLTAEVLGGDAVKRANDYIAYLDSKLNEIKSVTSGIAKEARPKVLNISSSNLDAITVDGSKTIINDWIEVAGGVNAAATLDSNMKEVSMEQILQWNPDVIILPSSFSATDKEKILSDATWQKITAVKNGKVYTNPTGVFLWNRYGAEEALQIQWAAKIINPDKFQSLDLAKETKAFYRQFFSYDLSDDEVQKILAGQKPE